MIVIDLLPVSRVEDRGFRQFLKVIDQKYSPPSRRTIMRDSLPRLYQSKKELINKVEEISWCSFTTDLWTSNTTMGYITVTCHFINIDWEMESSVLTTSHVPESHTSEYLATELRRIADDWKITTKIHCGITDGASNIKGAVRINQWNNLVCFAHTLNLVVTCAIEKIDEVQELIDQVKNVVSFFHRSTKASEKLRQIQTSFLLPEHKLIQQVSTRWNSSYYMLDRYLEQYEPIQMALSSQGRLDLAIPIEKNELIKQIITILHPFEAVTTELSSEKHVSASKIIPLARGLQKITNSSTISSPFCQELTTQMATRFAGIEEKSSS